MIKFTRLYLLYENSNFYKKRIISKYKHLIKPGEHTCEEIISSIKEKYDLKKISENQVDNVFWEYSVMRNLSADCEYNDCKCDDFEFYIYQVEQNEKSEKLYDLEDKNLIDEKNGIVFVMEKTTGYIVCNSQQLNLLLLLEKGIALDDYINETPVFYNYLLIYKEYEDLIVK